MKNIFRTFLLLVIILIAIILFRTFTFTSEKPKVEEVEKIEIPVSASQHLAQAITIPTISNENPADMDSSAFREFHQFVKETYPLTDSLLNLTLINDFSMIYEWPGSDKDLKPLIVMGHFDVVPVAEEDLDKWTHEPFAGRIVDGIVWGRGAIDDKVSVIGNLEAVEYLLRDGFQPKRTILLCFGHDEEIGGVNGAVAIVEHLKQKGVEAEFVLDEGFAISNNMIPGIDEPVALIGTAEKGFVTFHLSLDLQGGHSSMPAPETAIDVMARAVLKLKDNPFPAQFTPPVEDFMDILGPELPFAQKMAMANRWLFKPIIADIYSEQPSGNALIRTTTSPTIFRAGVKDNVIPNESRATVNFRTLPGTNIEDVLEHVRGVIKDDRIQITQGSFNSEAPQASSTESKGYKTIENTILQIFPGILTSPNLVIGATDSRHYYPLSEDVYRFTPINLNPELMKTFHGIDERLSVEDFNNAVRYYVQLIRNSQD